jgi:hypothetical protein
MALMLIRCRVGPSKPRFVTIARSRAFLRESPGSPR